MTTNELIERLKQTDPTGNLQVGYSNHEFASYDEIKNIKIVSENDCFSPDASLGKTFVAID